MHVGRRYAFSGRITLRGTRESEKGAPSSSRATSGGCTLLLATSVMAGADSVCLWWLAPENREARGSTAVAQAQLRFRKIPRGPPHACALLRPSPWGMRSYYAVEAASPLSDALKQQVIAEAETRMWTAERRMPVNGCRFADCGMTDDGERIMQCTVVAMLNTLSFALTLSSRRPQHGLDFELMNAV